MCVTFSSFSSQTLALWKAVIIDNKSSRDPSIKEILKDEYEELEQLSKFSEQGRKCRVKTKELTTTQNLE